MKARSYYLCRECGARQPRWMGRCPECGSWDSLEEVIPAPERPEGARSRSIQTARPVALRAKSANGPGEERLKTGIGEFDRAVGGGIVRGSVLLLGGEPGIGKSTLLLQVADALSRRGRAVLYVSGEESLEQIRQRAERLQVDGEQIYWLGETQVEAVLAAATELKPHLLIVDSIQTLTSDALESSAGSVGQIRECAGQLIRYAKSSRTPVFLIGHITKEGALAGPKVLEHMVDTVLYFEGDATYAYRIVRATKNRFGSTNEIGMFAITDRGLIPEENPSRLFLEQREAEVPGSAVIATLEGSRVLLLEVQALVAATHYGTPMRIATGIDRNRLALLIAVLEQRGGISLANADVFVNVTGGLQVSERAGDLGVIAAIASSRLGGPVDPQTVLIGEVGLGGEVRAVSRLEARLREAESLGFRQALIPRRQREEAQRQLRGGALRLIGVGGVREALERLFSAAELATLRRPVPSPAGRPPGTG
ncbi:MAG: DNA repair protein RadA [Candidatus Poribacteria bacterium]|nr:MAG: DNA repair protein RadA [Candidatus Poribacteria bacterium]